MLPADKYINRDLSQFEFNKRVLAQAQDPAVPLLDGDVLRELRTQLGTQNFAIVIEKFLEEAADRREDMFVASQAGDETAVARGAHTLASSFRSFGLQVAGDALMHLEQDIKSNQCPDIQSVCSDLQALLTKSLEALQRELETT